MAAVRAAISRRSTAMARRQRPQPGGVTVLTSRAPTAMRRRRSPRTSLAVSSRGSAPLETHLRDLEWVAACATAHEAVVEFAARGATTVPLKLLTLFNGDDRAVAHIRRLRPTIERVLDRVAGRQEWGVRVRLDEVAARRRHVERARRVTAGVSS